jgi:hypothetical protein
MRPSQPIHELRAARSAGDSATTTAACPPRRASTVSAGGVEKDVRFVQAVDDAYRTKYAHYDASMVDPMVQPEVRRTTLRLDAR